MAAKPIRRTGQTEKPTLIDKEMNHSDSPDLSPIPGSRRGPLPVPRLGRLEQEDREGGGRPRKGSRGQGDWPESELNDSRKSSRSRKMSRVVTAMSHKGRYLFRLFFLI